MAHIDGEKPDGFENENENKNENIEEEIEETEETEETERQCRGLFITVPVSEFTLDKEYCDLFMWQKGLWDNYDGAVDEEGNPLVNGETPKWFKG